MPFPGVLALLPGASLLPHTLGPYLVMMMLGFVIGTYGHAARLRWVIVVGVLLVLLATLVFPLAVVLTNSSPEPPTPDRILPGYNN